MAKPSLGFKPGPHYKHLGHFTGDKILREGHNFGPRRLGEAEGSADPSGERKYEGTRDTIRSINPKEYPAHRDMQHLDTLEFREWLRQGYQGV